nr:universal stress protein [Terribacillus saccharophilus]
MFKKIVVAIDGSDHSFLAAEHAIQLAKSTWNSRGGNSSS